MRCSKEETVCCLEGGSARVFGVCTAQRRGMPCLFVLMASTLACLFYVNPFSLVYKPVKMLHSANKTI